MKRIIFSFLTFGLLFFCLNSFAQQNKEVSLAFLTYLKKSDFDQAYSYFDQSVKTKLSRQSFESVWNGVNVQYGNWKGSTGIQSEFKDTLEIVTVKSEFESGFLDVQFVYNPSHKIIGFFFVPPKGVQEAYAAPAYDDPTSYKEQKVILKSNAFKLPAVLTLPKKTKKFPVVIFVQGSGPSDLDESIGGTKIFRDLAVGLANNNVATFRFDKRTKVAPEQFVANGSFTVKEEILDDVISAIDFVKGIEGVDTNQLYVLGHSLGGMIAPRLNLLKPELKGIILLAANARPLEDLIWEQTNYIVALSGNPEMSKKQLENLRKQVDLVKSKDLSTSVRSSDLPLGIPATYWLDLRMYDPVVVASQLQSKILILQGERDYQVTMADFTLWKQGLSSHKNVTFKSFPLLNHMFIEGKEKSTPSEYLKSGNIPEYIITDITHWIRN